FDSARLNRAQRQPLSLPGLPRQSMMTVRACRAVRLRRVGSPHGCPGRARSRRRVFGSVGARTTMRTDLFDFDLPPERIALRPVSPRDASRLLVVRPGGALEDKSVRELPDLLNPGDALVVNDTKVIPARLNGRRLGGNEPAIEATLTE